eukprot:2926997-Amphidinium_carterae.2
MLRWGNACQCSLAKSLIHFLSKTLGHTRLWLNKPFATDTMVSASGTLCCFDSAFRRNVSHTSVTAQRSFTPCVRARVTHVGASLDQQGTLP